MPLAYCFTNLSSADVPNTFEVDLSNCISEVLTKPIARIKVILNTGSRICNAGSSEPTFIMQLHALSVFDEKRNPEYYPKLFDFLTKALNLPANRLCVQFFDVAAHDVKNGE